MTCWHHNQSLLSVISAPLFTLFLSISYGQQVILPKAECQYQVDDFKIMTLAIEQGLKFFQNHLDQVLFDAAVGAIGVQGQIAVALSAPRKNIPQEMRTRLLMLENLANSVRTIVIRQVMNNSQISWIHKVHQLPWVTNISLWMQPPISGWKSADRMINSESNAYKSEWDEFDGSLSDTCINQVFFCETTNVTKDCYESMLSSPKYLYTLNHQVIYMLIAQKRNCGQFPNFRSNFVNDDLDPFIESLCSKVWYSARRIMSLNYFWGLRDLFTEQVGLCSIAGYPNFLRVDWLHKILSWQTKSGAGCFRDPSKWAFGNLEEFFDILPNALNVTSNSQTRQKRSEVKIIEKDTMETCFLHFTAVGLIAISVHLRYLIETCYM